MRYFRFLCLLPLLAGALAVPAGAVPRENMIFIHHSIGRIFLNPTAGAMRDTLAAWNDKRGSGVELWDHDYSTTYYGLTNPDGVRLGYNYGEEFNNTLQVDGYRQLFCTDNAARDSLLQNHELIVFKPGYESIQFWLRSEEELAAAKADYIEMRNFFDLHPEKLFVVVTQPPIHRLAPYLDERKDRARALASWLRSEEFLGGHANVRTFDLFDLLATPDNPADPICNTLYYGYEVNHETSDPHPNELAGEVIGPIFARFLYALAMESEPVDAPPPPVAPTLHPTVPNPFNPRAQISFSLPEPGSARLTLHDLAGRLLGTLVEGDLAAGDHTVVWEGRDARGQRLPAGVYLARLEAGVTIATRKLTLVR